MLGLTAVGRGGSRIPSRSGGAPGDILWLVGALGDASPASALLQLTAKPRVHCWTIAGRCPSVAAGRLIAPMPAMMDVSDGLLLDLRGSARQRVRSQGPILATVACLYRGTWRPSARVSRPQPAATIMPCRQRFRRLRSVRAFSRGRSCSVSARWRQAKGSASSILHRRRRCRSSLS